MTDSTSPQRPVQEVTWPSVAMKLVESVPFLFVLYIVAIMAKNKDAEVRDLIITLFGGMGFRMLPQSALPDIVRKASPIGPATLAIIVWGISRIFIS
jgi:hypothetical protein